MLIIAGNMRVKIVDNDILTEAGFRYKLNDVN